MRIIRRVVNDSSDTSITEAILTACNVPEDEYAAWSSGTAYTVGTRCIYAHKIYECLVNNTNYQPDQNTTGTTPKWLDCGYDNRWRMFDDKVGSQTTQADSITVTIQPGLIDAMAFLDLDATAIDIVMTDPVEGVVYTESIDLVAKSYIVDAYSYFFEPIILDDAAVLMGIPPYGNASIAITISNPGGTAKIGTLIAGAQKDLGGTQYSPSIGITDYSKKEVDAFGNYTVVQRAYSKRLTCNLMMDNTAVDSVHRTLAQLRSTPVAWVGDNDGTFSSMIIYGFYKSFDITVTYPLNSVCSLEIEGLA